MHMIEHLLLGDIAALLIVLGLTGPLIAPILQNKAVRPPARALASGDRLPAVGDRPVRLAAARRSTRPRCATPASTRSSTRCSSRFGVNMWMCLVGPLPTPGWFGNLGRLVYIVAVRLAGTVLGNIFLWSGTVFYPFYSHGDADPSHLAARRPEHRRRDHDGRGVLPHARAVLLAVPARRAARARSARTCSTTPTRRASS